MPFTPAHTVISRPIARFIPGVPVAAIVAGTISPDLEFFWHLEAHRTIGHLWPGVLTLSLPLGAIALTAWHVAIRPGLAALMPQPLGHIVRSERFGLADIVPSLIGLVIGTASHIVWDWFTHPHNPGPQLLGYSSEVAGALQIGSGLFGLGMLALWAWPHVAELSRHPVCSWFTDEQLALGKRAAVVGAGVGSVVLGMAALTASKRGLGPLLVWGYLATVYGAAAAFASARFRLPSPLRPDTTR